MALFRRRSPRDLLTKTKETVWPSMGWIRTFDYYRHRIFRTGDSTYKITAGLSIGVAVSFTPFLGTHFVQSLFASWFIRANYVAALAGTIFGNPWTFPFIFLATYSLGVNICELLGFHDFVALPDTETSSDNPMAFLKYMFSNPLKLLLPMTLGGYILAFLSWFVAYGLLLYPVKTMRRAYKKERLKRIYRRQIRQKRTENALEKAAKR